MVTYLLEWIFSGPHCCVWDIFMAKSFLTESLDTKRTMCWGLERWVATLCQTLISMDEQLIMFVSRSSSVGTLCFRQPNRVQEQLCSDIQRVSTCAWKPFISWLCHAIIGSHPSGVPPERATCKYKTNRFNAKSKAQVTSTNYNEAGRQK